MNLLRGVLDSTSGFTFTDNRVDIALTLPDSLELPVPALLHNRTWSVSPPQSPLAKSAIAFFHMPLPDTFFSQPTEPTELRTTIQSGRPPTH